MNKEDEGVPGVAAWDLFRAEDSVLVRPCISPSSVSRSIELTAIRLSQIREFLCEMKAEKRGIKVETYKSNFNECGVLSTPSVSTGVH